MDNVFKDLMDVKVNGTFFLRGELGEYTTVESLEPIMFRANEVCAKKIGKAGESIILNKATFEFSEYSDTINIVFTDDKGDNTERVPLRIVKPKDAKHYILTLAWEFIPEPKKVDMTFLELIDYHKSIRSYLSNSTNQEISKCLERFRPLVATTNTEITFSVVNILADGGTLVLIARKGGEEFRTTYFNHNQG